LGKQNGWVEVDGWVSAQGAVYMAAVVASRRMALVSTVWTISHLDCEVIELDIASEHCSIEHFSHVDLRQQ